MLWSRPVGGVENCHATAGQNEDGEDGAVRPAALYVPSAGTNKTLAGRSLIAARIIHFEQACPAGRVGWMWGVRCNYLRQNAAQASTRVKRGMQQYAPGGPPRREMLGGREEGERRLRGRGRSRRPARHESMFVATRRNSFSHAR